MRYPRLVRPHRWPLFRPSPISARLTSCRNLRSAAVEKQAKIFILYALFAQDHQNKADKVPDFP